MDTDVLVALITSGLSMVGIVVVALLTRGVRADAAEAAKNTKPNGGASSHDQLVRKLDGLTRTVGEVREEQRQTRNAVDDLRGDVRDIRTEGRTNAQASQAWAAGATAALAGEGIVVPAWPTKEE